MSDTDSFIEEVTEEVRRDRLFALMKRYGWVGVVGVVAIVGGAAYSEWSKATARSAAQARGDALVAALENNDAGARAAAVGDIAREGSALDLVMNMIQGNETLSAGDRGAAIAVLQSGYAEGADPIYRDVAAFKALVLAADMDGNERMIAFEALAAPGAPLRILAEEQMGLIELSQGKIDAARARYERLLQDAEMTNGPRQRIGEMMVALGTPAQEAGQ